ncbi:SDR family NAD(P)-dependent oxidoreductase [Stenoxybacter acetivorans]|uniref:SDR family NAD(P)-dependent oxidoreductase n=1 Tax=Stenoxybacter acetivorans TaxID=422441 RepID=UPI00055D6DFB|nr:SDR family NAD(P)-dependent oxidoreductase [Stenoxybacter acetivorans]
MKTILITGCSSGIGYAAAQLLRRQNWRVVVSCRQSKDVELLTAEGFDCLQLDITDSAHIQAAFLHIQQQYGRLDALFCNAGYGQTGAVEDIPRAALREQFETNVFGTWECINHAMRLFRQQGYGRILVNSSILGFAAMPWRGTYNSSKFALEGMCDTLRHELVGSGIYVSLLEPGPITTRFRLNAAEKFAQYIDTENSVHRKTYEAQWRRLRAEGAVAPFTLSADACAAVCSKALNAQRPKARYAVTVPTHVFWYLKKLLPTVVLDYLLRRSVAGKKEK